MCARFVKQRIRSPPLLPLRCLLVQRGVEGEDVGKRIKKKRKKERDPLLIQLLLLLVGEEKVLSFFKQVFEGERGGAVVILRGYKYI